MRADEFINLALERTKARVRINDMVTGLLGLLAFVLAYLLTVIVADQALQLGRTVRIWLLAILGVAAAAILALILMWPSIKRVNDLFAARLIERQAEDQFRNSLVTYVQSRDDPRLGTDVRGAIEAKAAHDLGHIDIDLVVNRRPLRIAVAALLAAMAVTLGFAIMSRKDFGTSLYRALGADVEAPTSTRIVMVRTDPEGPVMAGTNLRVIVSTADRQPETVELTMNRGGKYEDALSMQSVEPGMWEVVVENLLEDLVFDVRAGDARSRGHSIRVLPLPAITDVQTVLTYPAYTLRPPETRPTGNVEALRGTRVEVVARTNQPPKQAELIFADGARRQAMSTNGAANEARGKFTVQGGESYHVQFFDESLKHANAGAVRYRVTPLEDRPPDVQLDRAGSEVHVPAGGKLQLDVRARDDYSLASVTAHWQKVQPGSDAGTDGAQVAGAARSVLKTADAAKAVPAIDGQFAMDVTTMGLKEGDQALVWVSASDRLPGTPQEGRSAPIRVVIDPPGKSQGSGGDASQEPQQGSTAGTGGTSSQQKTAGLSPGERGQLEEFKRAIEKSQQQSQESPGEGTGAGSRPSDQQQPSGTGSNPDKGKPSDGSGQGDGGQAANNDPSTQNPNGNPTEGDSSQSTQRDPDKVPDSRHTQFDESGRGDGASEEKQLLRAVGPEIRRVAQELRRGTVDPSLLKELGWSETQLQQFVRAWQDDDRFDRAAQETTASGTATVTTQQGNADVTASSGAAGSAVGGGTTRSVGENDNQSENVEAAAQRTSPRYRSQVEAYLKSLSDAETSAP